VAGDERRVHEWTAGRRRVVSGGGDAVTWSAAVGGDNGIQGKEKEDASMAR